MDNKLDSNFKLTIGKTRLDFGGKNHLRSIVPTISKYFKNIISSVASKPINIIIS